jgi:orotate phosphoribosyltransferase-like protein
MLEKEFEQKKSDSAEKKLAIDRALNAGKALAGYLCNLKLLEKYDQDKPEVLETKADMLKQFLSYNREIKTSEIGYGLNCPLSALLEDVEKNSAQWLDEQRMQERKNHVGLMLWQKVFSKRISSYMKKYSLDAPRIGADEPRHISKFSELLNKKSFDVAVGIAREALTYSCLLEQLGGKVINLLIKEEEDRAYYPLDDLSVIKDKRVLVLEDDVVTGKTIQKVHEILLKNKPASLELYIGNMLDYKTIKDETFNLRYLLPDQIEMLDNLFKKTHLPLAEKLDDSLLQQGLGCLLRDYTKK